MFTCALKRLCVLFSRTFLLEVFKIVNFFCVSPGNIFYHHDSRVFSYFNLIGDDTLPTRVPFCIGNKYSSTCLFVCLLLLLFFFHSNTDTDQRQKHFIVIGHLPISRGAVNHELLSVAAGGEGKFWLYKFSPCTPSWSFLSKGGEGVGEGSWFLQLSIMHPIPVKPCRNQTWRMNDQKQIFIKW